MALRLLTLAAVAMIAFYAGVVVDGGGATSYDLSVPESIPVVPAAPSAGSTQVSWSYASSTVSDSDGLVTAAAIGAIVAALFLLARLGILVARRMRRAHA